MSTDPILYSFRRCPYAMRGRMALLQAKIRCEHREIVLRDKPEHMLAVSPKGTVPTLLLPDGRVIDESLDIMMWALSHNDPDAWLEGARSDMMHLIERNDTTFKKALDRYKYPGRYPDEDCGNAREDGVIILDDLNARIEQNGYLSGDKKTLADIAIFPFVRQFAHVDRDWFFTLPLAPLQTWLEENLVSEVFVSAMKKFEIWAPDSEVTYNY